MTFVLHGIIILVTQLVQSCDAVLRFPDEYYDVRWPLQWTECEEDDANGHIVSPAATAATDGRVLVREQRVFSTKGECYAHLRRNILDDLDCSAVTPDNEYYVPHLSDKLTLDACPDFVHFYDRVFNLSVVNSDFAIGRGPDYRRELMEWMPATDTSWRTDAFERGEQLDDELLARRFEEAWTWMLQKVHRKTHVYHDDRRSGRIQQSSGGSANVVHERPGDPSANVEPLSTRKTKYRTLGNFVVMQKPPDLLSNIDGADNSTGTHLNQPRLDDSDSSNSDAVNVNSLQRMEAPPDYGNTTADVMRYHLQELQGTVESLFRSGRSFQLLAHEIQRRICLMIENIAMTILLNFHIWQLEGHTEYEDGLLEKLVPDEELFNAGSPAYVWHDVGPKRWNVLTYLIDKLLHNQKTELGDVGGLKMLEVGIDTANSTERLLDTYGAKDLALHVGVDPYGNKPELVDNGDRMYEHVKGKLHRYTNMVYHKNTLKHRAP